MLKLAFHECVSLCNRSAQSSLHGLSSDLNPADISPNILSFLTLLFFNSRAANNGYFPNLLILHATFLVLHFAVFTHF